MLNRFDYVRITLAQGEQREGYLVDVSGQTGTLAGMNSNTAFHLPTTLIEVLHPGSKPVFLPGQVKPSSKPYRVACLVGAHTALEDYFAEEAIAKRFAQAQVGAYTNNVPDKAFHQFSSVLVLTTDAYEHKEAQGEQEVLSRDGIYEVDMYLREQGIERDTPRPGNAVSYTTTNRQRAKVFAHALGLIMSVCSIKEFDKTREGIDCKVHNGVDAMEVFYGYAEEFSYEEVLHTFESLPGEPYQDFIHYWDTIQAYWQGSQESKGE